MPSPRRLGTGSGGLRRLDDSDGVAVAEFIYTMYKARKAHGDKVILDDVTLSFMPGAKIGVVGPNGAGKSTVLKIMAGLDHANNGGFEGAFTNATNMRNLRAALRVVARDIVGPDVSDVLIIDILRQDV